MSQSYITILIDTLEKKKDALNRILQITQEQETLAKTGSYDENDMERTLDEKEIQIARINTLDDGFQAVYDRVRQEIYSNREAYRKEIERLQELIRTCTTIGNQIMVLEERNKEYFRVLFTQSQKYYSTSKNKANVAQNYFRTMNNTKIMDSCFLDRKQ